MPFEATPSGSEPLQGQAARRRVPAWAWGLLVLLLGLGGALWLASLERDRSEREARREFVKQVERFSSSLHEQLRQCEQLIRAFQSIFLSSDAVTPDEYMRAYENMQASGDIRVSLQALAYAERRLIAGSEHYITTMYVPLEGNEALRGLDITRQPMNMEALRRSRDSNQVAMSPPFRLIQSRDSAGPLDGIILRLPVYRPGPIPASIEARRQDMVGSLGASFRISDLIDSVIPEAPSELASVKVEDVGDGRSYLLYERRFATASGGLPHVVEFRFGGRTWRFTGAPRAALDGQEGWWAVVWIGAAISALLAALAWSLVSTREQAIALGTAMSARFRASEERFRTLNELLPCLVLLVRKDDGTIVYRNAVARQKLDPHAGVRSGFSMLLEIGGQDHLQTVGEETTQALEVQMRDADGKPFWATTWISSIEIDDVPMWLLVASDTTEQRQLTERLSYQASHDPLTRLFNRREFELRAQALLSSHGRQVGALLFIDLDQFKLINDTSGHGAGDELLVRLAMLMKENLRPHDMLARLGGDEFGVLLSGVRTTEEALQAAERMRAGIEAFLFAWEGRNYTISASIGVVMLRSAASLKELFAHADAACYLAKEAGRNRIHLYAEDDAGIARRMGEMEWANRIREALNDGRLLLDYQELHPLRGEDGVHVELLLRLRDEDGGEVLPGAFLPAAERYGLMPLVDRWVVETALANLDRLHPSGAALATCAINLSAASLEDPGLFERIAQLLELHRIDPRRLVFEITETVAMRDFAASSALIARLRKLGCRVALDDFGAGMSSFGYLKDLELDMVKIDGIFVQNMASDRMSRSIVRAVAEIGHEQGLQVVAEWVSSQELLDLLAGMSVDYAQGFALHRPQRVLFQREASAGA
ncbi:MAG: EAL domain-containing protein [Thermomonas haemolytica]